MKTVSYLYMFLVSALGTPTYAQSSIEVQSVQYALSRLGVYANSVDGLNGPGTRQAISAYAADTGIDDDFNTVFMELYRFQEPWVGEWNDAVQEAVDHALNFWLADFESARFSGEKKLYVGEDSKFVSACVELNAKNAHGAYVGYQWFFLRGMQFKIGSQPAHFSFIPEDMSTLDHSALCGLGFVLELPK